MLQPELLSGFYRCHNCGRNDAAHIRKVGRFCLCDQCASSVLPDFIGEAVTVEQRQKIADYWSWIERMNRRYPRPINHVAQRRPSPPSGSDSHNPLCACGQSRRPFASALTRDLFGGPFYRKCPVCEAKANIDAILSMASAIHPDWDDEDWLDLLLRTHPEAFDLGVLPAYWFEHKQP